MLQDLNKLYQRDLNRVITDLELYADERKIWQLAKEIKNPAGNLVLHLVGNLNFFIGVKLGGTDFVRDREAEFSTRDVPRQDLIAQLRQTAGMLEHVLTRLAANDLEATYPLEVFGYPMSTGHFLIHLYGHLNWHGGQINYHRRLV